MATQDDQAEDLDLYADTAVGDVRDPYPEYAAARSRGAVGRVEHYGVPVFMVYRYDEVDRILRDNETFSSGIYKRAMRPVMGPTILEMDGREHLAHRSLIGHAFRQKALASWEHSLIEPTVHALIDRFADRGRAELVRELTFQFPVRIIAKILGIPSEDYASFARLSIELISIAVAWDRGIAASQKLREYFSTIIEERRRRPAGDLISDLVHAEIDGERLPEESLHGFLRLLLPAGVETTYRLLGNLLFALLCDDEQMAAVREDRSLIPAAIEEALRWEAPVQFVARAPVREVDIDGERIPAGSSVTACLGSANRDERRYADPDRFDLSREGPPHLAFGGGQHFCLGAHLGRLETSVAMRAILDRLGDLRLDPGDDDPHVHGYAFRSPTALPVRFSAT